MIDMSDLARRWFTPDPVKTAARATRRLGALVHAHGGSGTAVISYLGRPGHRICAVAADGTFGDAVVPTAEIATTVCADAGLVVGTWDRDTVSLIAPTPSDRLRMAGTGR